MDPGDALDFVNTIFFDKIFRNTCKLNGLQHVPIMRISINYVRALVTLLILTFILVLFVPKDSTTEWTLQPSSYYRDKLIKYGRDYVHALAKEQKTMDDHAYSPSETHYCRNSN